MPEYKFEFDVSSKAADALGELSVEWSPARIAKLLTRQLNIEVGGLREHIIATQMQGQSGLHYRSGRLAKAIQGRITEVQGLPVLQIGVFSGPALAYAGVLNEGTKSVNSESPYPHRNGPSIRSTRGKGALLAIPVNQAVGANGRAKRSSPRAYKDLKFVKLAKRKDNVVGLLVKVRRGVKTTFDRSSVYYILVKRIDIKPSFYLQKGLRTYMPRLTKNLERAIVDALE